MIKISQEEIMKLAHISQIHIYDTEIDEITEQIKSVLNYAQRVQEIFVKAERLYTNNINILRNDIPQKSNNDELIVNQSPEREDRYFVVPAILEQPK